MRNVVLLLLVLVGCSKKAEVGMPEECEEYAKKWEACYQDPKARAAAEPGFKQLREGWKSLSEQGDIAREQLRTTCKAQIEALANNPACK